MCLILFCCDAHPDYRLVLLANRDEFYDRPTAPLNFWEDAPHVLAGRDLKAMGTWLAMSTEGRLAAVTNYRDPSAVPGNGPSRGALVTDFVTGAETPTDYLGRVTPRDDRYDGYNLIVGDPGGLLYQSNRGRGAQAIERGTHGLSNHLLDTPWPKVKAGIARLEAMLKRQRPPELGDYFALLSDSAVFPDRLLPRTGVSLEWERLLSPLFIASPHYGTRSSSVILIDRDGNVTFAERTIGPKGENGPSGDTRRFDFRVDAWRSQG